MKKVEIPDVELLKKELERVQYKSKYRSVLRSTIYMLIEIGRAHV